MLRAVDNLNYEVILTERDLKGRTKAWYRFTETHGKTYGPRTFTWILRAYGHRDTCEATVDVNGRPGEDWIPVIQLASRVIGHEASPEQLARLSELGFPDLPAGFSSYEAKHMIADEEKKLEMKGALTAADRAEAKDAGIDTTEMKTKQDLEDAFNEIEAAEDEQALRKELAPLIKEIERGGASVPTGVDEDALYELKDVVELFHESKAIAIELGLKSSAIPKPKRWDRSLFESETRALERFNSDAEHCDPDEIRDMLDLSRNVSQADFRSALLEMYLAIREEKLPVSTEIDRWLGERIQVYQASAKTLAASRAANVVRPAISSPQHTREIPQSSWFWRLLSKFF